MISVPGIVRFSSPSGSVPVLFYANASFSIRDCYYRIYLLSLDYFCTVTGIFKAYLYVNSQNKVLFLCQGFVVAFLSLPVM